MEVTLHKHVDGVIAGRYEVLARQVLLSLAGLRLVEALFPSLRLVVCFVVPLAPAAARVVPPAAVVVVSGSVVTLFPFVVFLLAPATLVSSLRKVLARSVENVVLVLLVVFFLLQYLFHSTPCDMVLAVLDSSLSRCHRLQLFALLKVHF